MDRAVRLVIFDLGSTLIFEQGPWPELFRRADQELWRVLHEAGVRAQPQEIYGEAATLFDYYYLHHRNDLSEPTSAAVLLELLKHHGDPVSAETVGAALRAMYSVTQTNWQVEQDALPTLRALRQQGLHIALISNASDDANTQALIDKAGLRTYLDYIVSSAAFGVRKPEASIFRSVLDHFGLQPEQALMIGDNYEADIAGAMRLGLHAAWLTRRAADLPEAALHAASVIKIGTLRDVLHLVSS